MKKDWTFDRYVGITLPLMHKLSDVAEAWYNENNVPLEEQIPLFHSMLKFMSKTCEEAIHDQSQGEMA
jgi:hypothetical protein